MPAYLKPYFSRVIRITRLREVKVLLGFTRVDAPDPDADVRANVVYLNKGKSENGCRRLRSMAKVFSSSLIRKH